MGCRCLASKQSELVRVASVDLARVFSGRHAAFVPVRQTRRQTVFRERGFACSIPVFAANDYASAKMHWLVMNTTKDSLKSVALIVRVGGFLGAGEHTAGARSA